MRVGQFDTEKPVEELLTDVVQASMGTNPTQPAIPLASFATLLIRLTQDAERTANRVVYLTWALLFLTVVLAGAEAGPPIMKFFGGHAGPPRMTTTTLNIFGLILNLFGVLGLFRYGMPYRVRTYGMPRRSISCS